MTVVAGTFHVHPDHPDAPAALEVKPLAPLREHFPTLAQRYPERAMLSGHPPSDDPRAYDRESTR
jgi:proteasome lid subunit RPN8/RPN11